MTDLTRRITFRNGTADHLLFLVEGPEGAIQFLISTHWSCAAAQPFNHWDVIDRHMACHPYPTDVGFHSRQPVEWATAFDTCPVLGDVPCWYDGSGLRAEELFRTFAEQGEAAVWTFLEEEYRAQFRTEVPA